MINKKVDSAFFINKKIEEIWQENGNSHFTFSDGTNATISSSGEIEIEIEEPLCNLCGKTCILNEEHQDIGGLSNITVSGGYFSTPGNGEGALDDYTRYTFSLCEFCLDWIFSKCQIPVHVSDFSDGEEQHFIPAKIRVEDDSWRKQKERFMKEYISRNIARVEV